MPVDIKALREAPEAFRESERRRFRDPAGVDAVLEADATWRAATARLNELRAELGRMQKEIGRRKKASVECEAELREKRALDEGIAAAEEGLRAATATRAERMEAIGNLLAPEVPTARGETGNVVLRASGAPRRGGRPHFEVLQMLGACDVERGTKVAGRRGYFLRGPGVMLNLALQNYGAAFLAARGYTLLQPPFFMRKEVMSRTAELRDFDDQLYKVSAKPPEREPADGSPDAAAYLIATSEQPISAMHQDETLPRSDLPLRYAGISPCFRAETSSRGLDAKGLFRVHQFEKVEQFCICAPEESCELFQEMVAISEEFHASLGLPYRVVAIASGAMNSTAAMKYDLEAWFPASQEYRELVSCSNCTDFQARALGVRIKETAGTSFAHMLNATLCATERTMCCLAENCQQETGIRVPRVLVPYLHGQEFFSYVTDLPTSSSRTADTL